jgi:galactokinase
VSLPLVERFRAWTGRSPEGVWQAPGRVNLIGEHTDYNGGLAIAFAIDRQVTVAARRRPDRIVRFLSTPEFGEATADLDRLGPAALPPWARYPVGVAWALEHLAGLRLPGVDVAIGSTVPAGGGLSSSAALEVAVAVALDDLCQAGLGRLQLARVCHAAETDFVGAPVGLLDQLAVLYGRLGHGLLIDFRSLAIEPAPLATGPLVVVDTHVRHANADGAYAARRASCQQAADRLGVTDLRAATQEMVEEQLDGELRRRARHVVTENERVLETARRLRAGAAGIGDLLTASHASLRDDYQVSCPELDAVVEAVLAAGAGGARMTGAGFGGCAIVVGLEPESAADALRRRGLDRPTVFAVVASEGAGRVA